MGDKIAWTLSEFTTHSANLSTLQNYVDTQARDAEATAKDQRMYGLLHSGTLMPALNAWTASQRQSITALADLLKRRSEAVKQAGLDYQKIEKLNEDLAKQITAELNR